MWFNLITPGGLTHKVLVQFDYFRQHLIVHTFGVALGLGHEHQMPHLATALDKNKMIEFLAKQMQSDEKAAEAKFDKDYECYSEHCAPKYLEGSLFDPWSIMCCP